MGYNKFNSIEEYRRAINSTIDHVMETYVADKAREAMQKSADEYIYDREPIFDHRRGNAGGLRAKYNMSPTYLPATKTLIVEAVAEWQNLGNFRYIDGRGTYGGDLSDVIENDGLYSMEATHFAEHAEEEYGKKQFAKDLQHGLVTRGL